MFRFSQRWFARSVLCCRLLGCAFSIAGVNLGRGLGYYGIGAGPAFSPLPLLPIGALHGLLHMARIAGLPYVVLAVPLDRTCRHRSIPLGMSCMGMVGRAGACGLRSFTNACRIP